MSWIMKKARMFNGDVDIRVIGSKNRYPTIFHVFFFFSPLNLDTVVLWCKHFKTFYFITHKLIVDISFSKIHEV